MKKDVIYIDIEDDVTSIIEKLKNSTEKIVALVPPKGNSVFQSVVNLKLLKRASEKVGKQPVIVTNNHALTALAGGLSLYVAKNLQSKPVLASTLADELPDDEAVEVSDEVGQIETVPANATSVNDDEVELEGDELAALAATDAVDKIEAKKPNKGHGKSKKVPNFDNFRKKLLIGGGIALLLIVVLLAVFGRSKATIVVRAETTPVDVAFESKLNANSVSSDPGTYNLKALYQEKKQSLSQSFTPTGQKDIGEKATGTVRFSTGAISALGTTIPAGTKLTASGGLVFVTTESVTITISNYNGANAGIAASESGPKYNGANGAVSGAPSGISASITKSPAGGTSQVVKVVTQDDVAKAQAALEQKDVSAIKLELSKAFGEKVRALDDSFLTSLGAVSSEPAVDQQANDAKLTAEVTYSMLGVSEDDLGSALDSFVTTKMTNKEQQRVYDNGLKDIKFEKVASDARTATYKVTSLAQYGPQFDTEKLKEEVTGKKFGEVRSYLQDLPGVKGVDIKLTPFWARKVPGVNRIDIKLDVANNNGG